MTAAAPMRALTIRQPWADAIVHVDHPKWGRKRIENRSWPIPDGHVGTRIMIHAGKAADRRALQAGVRPGPDARGAVIATALLTSCHFDNVACRPYTGPGCGPWSELDVFHWVLADVQPLAAPIPTNGLQRLWTPSDAVQQAVRGQQAAVLRAAADLFDCDGPVTPHPGYEIRNGTVSVPDPSFLAQKMRGCADALERGETLPLIDTPRLLTDAYRLTTRPGVAGAVRP